MSVDDLELRTALDPETLQRALIKHGFHEAAALVAADIEAQELEEADELDDDRVVYASFGTPDEPLEAA